MNVKSKVTVIGIAAAAAAVLVGGTVLAHEEAVECKDPPPAPPKPDGKNQFHHGAETTTGWSGVTGLGGVKRFGPPKCSSLHYTVECAWAFRGMAIGEMSDEPCFVFGHAQKLSDRARDERGWGWFDKPCVKPASCIKYKIGDQEYEMCKPQVGAGSGLQELKWSDRGRNYLHGLQVCDNGKTSGKNQYKIKGLRIWSATVNAKSGAIGKQNATPLEFELPNCKKWRSKMSCPSDRVASGVYVSTSSDDNYATALKLECQKVERR